MILTFDGPSHSYALDGVCIPSVTQVLEDVGIIDYSYLPGTIRELALKRGQAVHLATQYDDEGSLGKCPEWLAGYVHAWRSFRRNSGFVPESIERRAFHPTYRYAGTLDRLGMLGERRFLVDLKTNDAPWWTALQTAAYAAFFPEPRAIIRASVELHSDGTYRMQDYPCKDWHQDFQTFLAALSVFNVKRRYINERRAAA